MVGNRIKQLREEKHLSQDELAKKMSVSPSTIGMYERDEREPNDEMTLKLADFFNVSTDYLLGKSNIRNPEDKLKDEFEFAYHKEMEGLTEEEITDALRFYKEMKNRVKGDK